MMVLTILIILALTILFGVFQKHSFKQILVLSLFNVYLVFVIIGIVGYPSLSQTLKDGLNIFNPTIQLIPFAEGLGISDILNIFLFMPFGFLVATLYEKGNSFLRVLLIGFSFSLLIEVSQLFTYYRITDVTDLITNTLGTALGFIVFKMLRIKYKPKNLSIRIIYSFLIIAAILSYLNT